MRCPKIAERVGLSQSSCWRRIALLEEAGWCADRVALLDAARLGLAVMVFANVKLSTLAGLAQRVRGGDRRVSRSGGMLHDERRPPISS